MKHKSLDLSSEILRASLPASLEGFLFPTFEAISNSLHSIEDRFGAESYEKGKIDVEINIADERITVIDNGDGLNVNNLNAFLTPFTGNKLRRNGKGFGRFISLKVFERVYYASPTEVEPGTFVNSTYEYSPLGVDDNLIVVDLPDIIRPHTNDRGLTASFQRPKTEYKKYFDFVSDKCPDDYTEESVLIALIDHFLIDFIQKKVPKHFVCTIDDADFNLNDYFSGSLSHVASRSIDLSIDDQVVPFNFEIMQIEAGRAKRHNLYFYADNRATSDLENISKELREGYFESEDGRRYYYLVAVTSEFFKASQSRDKIENLNAKVTTESGTRSITDVIAAAAKKGILDLEPHYTSSRRAVMRKNVEELIALDPLLRRGLGSKTIDEFVEERGILESREQIASDLFVIRLRDKFDFRKVNSSTPFSELERVVRDKIPADAKEALAVYVAYRNDVIKIFKEMLRRDEGKLAKEDAVHHLVYPRFKDSEEIDYSSHNLWLIDDDLAYAEFISSDRTSTGRGRGHGSYAHDLLVNNQNELLVVEMKRPQKLAYAAEEEGRPTDNPVQQLKDQIGEIRDRGSIITSGGRVISIPGDRMVRGYILADWNDKFRTYLENEDFIITDHGGPMAYRYYSTRNMMIEVLAFDRLADRAAKRNAVFVEILEGRSSSAGSPVSRLAGE